MRINSGKDLAAQIRAAIIPRIDCDQCGRDWGHSFCGNCQGWGYIQQAQVRVSPEKLEQWARLAENLIANDTSEI